MGSVMVVVVEPPLLRPETVKASSPAKALSMRLGMDLVLVWPSPVVMV